LGHRTTFLVSLPLPIVIACLRAVKAANRAYVAT
jgi:hypothetical protein